MNQRQIRQTIINNSPSYIRGNLLDNLQITKLDNKFKAQSIGRFDESMLKEAIRVILELDPNAPIEQPPTPQPEPVVATEGATFTHTYTTIVQSLMTPPLNVYRQMFNGHYPNVTNNQIIATPEQWEKIFKKLNYVIDESIVPPLCQDCEMEVDEVSVNTIYTGSVFKYVCSDCETNNYFTCDACQFQLNIDDEHTTTRDDDTFCEQCLHDNAFYCDDCDEWVSGTDYWSNDNSTVCEGCYDSNYFTCNACDYMESNSNSIHCDGCDEYFCESCWDEHDCGERTTSDVSLPNVYTRRGGRNYNANARCTRNYEPRLKFFEGEENPMFGSQRFVGTEIEAEEGTFNYEELLKDLPKSTAMVSDGSVCGVEINTPPAQGKALVDIITKACEALKKHNYKSTTKCGVHVHIDSRDFRDNHKKIIQLIKTYYATEDLLFSMLPPSRWNSTYCKRLSQNWLYDSFKKKNVEADKAWYKTEDVRRIAEAKRSKWGERYYGLNVHSLFFRGTIELRYHSGTLNPDKILKWVAINLRIFEWVMKSYDEETIKKLYDMETGYEKFRFFIKTFNLSNELADYMEKRTNLFNVNWEVKFNKGKIARAIENEQENMIKSIVKKEVRKVIGKEIKSKKEYYMQSYGNLDRFNELEVKVEITSRIESEIRRNIPKRQMNNEMGFISNEEIQSKRNAFERGMLAVENRSLGEQNDNEFVSELGLGGQE